MTTVRLPCDELRELDNITSHLFSQEATAPDGAEMVEAGNETVIRGIGREGRGVMGEDKYDHTVPDGLRKRYYLSLICQWGRNAFGG